MRSNRGNSALLVLLLLIVGGLIGYWFAQPSFHTGTSQSVGTSGTLSQTQEKAREEGRAVGERIAVATEKMKENVAEAALTTKIKAKMALDDSVKSRAIDVSTSGTTVTLTGTVRPGAEHERAVPPPRETAGVTHVVDRLNRAQ